MTGTLYFYTHVFSRLEYVISSAWCEVSMNVIVFVERTAAKPSNYLGCKQSFTIKHGQI